MIDLGATVTADGTRFAVWSSRAKDVRVRLFSDRTQVDRDEELTRREGGIFDAELRGVGPGALYKFVVDGRELPDPYARFLPFGVHGPARVEARPPARIRERRFQPPALERWVLYELHVGTFTPEGTWRAAKGRLDALVDLGINAVEVMPIAAFAGTRGWGYDGVALFAPFAGYGAPDDVRDFVAACHDRGIAVVLDDVYNHFGPDGNYLSAYSPEYFTPHHRTAWGDAPDYGEPHLRRLVLQNARYWLGEFDFDGLRLDATHAILDDSPTHILAELASVGAAFSPKRTIIAEDERNDPGLVARDHLDALWADDFHHEVHVLLTGERDGYYAAYTPSVAALARTIERGWLYEGEIYAPWKKARGRAAPDLEAWRFVYAIQNHDQIGNRPFGTRLGQDAGLDAQAAAAVLLLFLPMVPLLFMGEEWGASSPFLYFTDHAGELGRAVTEGRHAEFAHFAGFSDPSVRDRIPDPQAPATFERSRLEWGEREREPHARILALYKHAIALRRSDAVLASPARDRLACEANGSLLAVRRWLGEEQRVLLFNAGVSDAPAPFAFTRDDVLVASTKLERVDRVPGRAALVVRPSRPSLRDVLAGGPA